MHEDKGKGNRSNPFSLPFKDYRQDHSHLIFLHSKASPQSLHTKKKGGEGRKHGQSDNRAPVDRTYHGG